MFVLNLSINGPAGSDSVSIEQPESTQRPPAPRRRMSFGEDVFVSRRDEALPPGVLSDVLPTEQGQRDRYIIDSLSRGPRMRPPASVGTLSAALRFFSRNTGGESDNVIRQRLSQEQREALEFLLSNSSEQTAEQSARTADQLWENRSRAELDTLLALTLITLVSALKGMIDSLHPSVKGNAASRLESAVSFVLQFLKARAIDLAQAGDRRGFNELANFALSLNDGPNVSPASSPGERGENCYLGYIPGGEGGEATGGTGASQPSTQPFLQSVPSDEPSYVSASPPVGDSDIEDREIDSLDVQPVVDGGDEGDEEDYCYDDLFDPYYYEEEQYYVYEQSGQAVEQAIDYIKNAGGAVVNDTEGAVGDIMNDREDSMRTRRVLVRNLSTNPQSVEERERTIRQTGQVANNLPPISIPVARPRPTEITSA